MSCLPFVQRGEKKIEPVKRFMDEEDDESFVSFASTKTDSFNDRILSTPYGFHYRIHGPSWLLLTEPFYSSYISSPQGLVIQTVNTPVASCNSFSIIGGKFLILKLDKSSYQRLGIAAKHADFRLISENVYLSIVPLRKLSSTSKSLQRIRECLQEICPLTMDVFSFNREVLFSLEFKVEKILNTVSKKKATTVSIPVVEVQQLTTAIQPIRSSISSKREEEIQNQLFSAQMNRQEVIGGFLDWIGCAEASSLSMNMGLAEDLSGFRLPSCFHYIDGNEFNFVNVYKSSGYFSSEAILQHLDFLKSHVNSGKSPFATLSVYGSNWSAVQWIVGSTVSEFNYLQDDDAHLVFLVFPNSLLYIVILASDMETRL
ncbi:hypothetical protein JH06_3573 [Blastocystis sp. subtype 4]|uniref:hypothetical protein n=1 Tax=Blastocystis sp. subtype 4 TaxID=944170 RepID=UPI000711F3F0|nr:hypothetical protein JH06_3573 [Blastocystis sp. subtype 4]KNB42726.1 hypothetical protein JH06_3573 [Blastocystis sp. subtype 4]|eukprot:XP_014526169.1 hypothetical protein JH06_3573 [Blastocystis sp. subtype 4]